MNSAPMQLEQGLVPALYSTLKRKIALLEIYEF